ncbi:MAG: response regulator [Chloroflexota bacterium]
MIDGAPADSGMPARVRPRVVVVDADDRTRESLVALLGIGGRLEVVGSAGAASAASAVVRATKPDAVLIDPRLPDVADGIAAVQAIRRESPGVRIVAMSPTVAEGERIVDCGADGSVRKTFRAQQLLEAIRSCLAPTGQAAAPRSMGDGVSSGAAIKQNAAG